MTVFCFPVPWVESCFFLECIQRFKGTKAMTTLPVALEPPSWDFEGKWTDCLEFFLFFRFFFNFQFVRFDFPRTKYNFSSFFSFSFFSSASTRSSSEMLLFLFKDDGNRQQIDRCGKDNVSSGWCRVTRFDALFILQNCSQPKQKWSESF